MSMTTDDLFPLDAPDPADLVKWEKDRPERFYVLPRFDSCCWFDDDDYPWHDVWSYFHD